MTKAELLQKIDRAIEHDTSLREQAGPNMAEWDIHGYAVRGLTQIRRWVVDLDGQQ